MGTNVKIGTKPAANTAAKPAGKKGEEKPKKERKKREKKVVEFTVDENNIPNIADAEGNLIVGIPPKAFFANLTDEQRKNKTIRHEAKTRALEYAKHMAEYKLTEHLEKKNPKAKMKAKYDKMMEKLKAMRAELGDDVEDVE